MEEIDLESLSIQTTKAEEIKDEKKHVSGASKQFQEILNFILKYNPIDPLNRLVRKFFGTFDLLDKTDRLFYWGAFPIIRNICRMYWNMRVEGEMFPDYGGGIVASNHVSHLDPFFVSSAVQRRIRWMSKIENFETPLVTTLFTNLGAFPLHRGEQDLKAYSTATKIILNGEYLGMFPEGTRSYDGILKEEFHTGTIRLAVETGCPIVPACVLGTAGALAKGKLLMKPTQVLVRIGKPIYYTDYYAKELTYPDAKKLSDDLREKIKDLIQMGYSKGLEKDPELSIENLSDMIKFQKNDALKSHLKPKTTAKKILKFIDDTWYGFLRALEVFDLRTHFQEAIQMFSGNLVHQLCNTLIPYKTIDFDKYIPKEGAAVIAPSHNSEWDVIMIATAITQKPKRILHQMSKQSLFRTPIVNAWVRNHHAFPLKRGGHDVESFLYAKELLEAEQLVCTYPEGTTNPGNGQLLEGHTGAVRLAIEAKVPIIPVGITGTENIYPKHAKMLNFGKSCVLKAGEPFMEHAKYWDAPEMPSFEVLKDLTSKMMARIKDLQVYNSPGL